MLNADISIMKIIKRPKRHHLMVRKEWGNSDNMEMIIKHSNG